MRLINTQVMEEWAYYTNIISTLILSGRQKERNPKNLEVCFMIKIESKNLTPKPYSRNSVKTKKAPKTISSYLLMWELQGSNL